MIEQTIHIKAPISRGDMESVIEGLEMACPGSRIEITETFDLIVIDERQAAALEALFGGSSGLAEAAMFRNPRTATPKNGGKKMLIKKKAEQKKEPGAHSYIIERTGEVISTQKLHKRLAAKDILEFTVVTKKDKRFIVTADEQGVFSLAKEPRGTPGVQA